MKKFIKMLTALVLSISTVVCAVIPAYAARGTSSVLYLSDLMMAYGDTKEEAQKKLTDAKYQVVNVNLNRRGKDEDSDNKGKKYVYIGYKVTSDPKEAITDITAINMEGDYNISKYEQVLKDSYEGMVKLGKFYENMANAFRENYNNGQGTDNAKLAYEILNMYSNDDVLNADGTPMRMGDWFLQGEFFRTDGKGGTWDSERKLIKDPIVTILAEANPDILNVLGTALAFATASSSKTDNFYTRLKGLTQDEIDAEVASNELFEKAEIILETVEALGSLIKHAESYMDKLDKEVSDSVAGMVFDKTDEGYANAYTLSLYMKGVKVGNRTLYDIVTSDSLKQQDLYPLIMAMTKGQFDAFVIGGSTTFFIAELNAAEDDELSVDDKKKVEDNYNALKDYVQLNVDVENYIKNNVLVEGSSMSIFSAVDRSVFGGNVGVTDNANASMALDPNGNFLLGNIDRSLEIGLLSGIAVSLVSTVVIAGFAAREMNIINSNLSKDFYALNIRTLRETISNQRELVSNLGLEMSGARIEWLNGLPDDQYAKKLMEITESKDVVDSTLYSNLTEYNDAVSTYNKLDKASKYAEGLKLGYKVAFGVTMVITAVYAGMELWNYYHPTLKEIPLLMMDKKYDKRTKTDNFVMYNCVCTPDGEAGDVNAFDERQWIALYYTKDKNSGGSPLKANYKTQLAANFAPIHTFGSGDAYNMNQFLFGSGHPIVNLVFEKGDRNLILATTFSDGAKHALVASVSLVAGFGLAFGASMIVVKSKKKKEALEA